MSALRRRLENSARLARIVATVVGGYLNLCNRTTRWAVTGRDDLIADLEKGPVLLLCWHGRSLMAAPHWPVDAAPLSSLYAASPIGRVSGAYQRSLGLQPMEMADGMSNRAASRMILRRVKDGVSIGMTGDGPLGPAEVMQGGPLEWARVTQMPVWGYAFATTRHRRLKTWDKMVLPRPFGRGAQVFRRWDKAIPRKPTTPELAAARGSLSDLLDAVTETAERMCRD